MVSELRTKFSIYQKSIFRVLLASIHGILNREEVVLLLVVLLEGEDWSEQRSSAFALSMASAKANAMGEIPVYKDPWEDIWLGSGSGSYVT